MKINRQTEVRIYYTHSRTAALVNPTKVRKDAKNPKYFKVPVKVLRVYPFFHRTAYV